MVLSHDLRKSFICFFLVFFLVLQKIGREYFFSTHAPLLVTEEEASLSPEPEPTVTQEETMTKVISVKKGDTFSSVLSYFGFSNKEIMEISAAFKPFFQSKDLKEGHIFSARFKNDKVQEILFRPSKKYGLKLTTDGSFSVTKEEINFIRKTKTISGTIDASFYKTALHLGLPTMIVKVASQALSHVVDMQHSLSKGDYFQIVYEQEEDEKGTLQGESYLKYVSISIGHKLHKIYCYHSDVASTRFYNAQGECVQRKLLYTPIDPKKMRISSTFQRSRLHPVMGYTRAHKGVDFAAPKGTAVMASGDGVVVKSGYVGSYGNYVRIRHGGGYETAYAHLSKISRDVFYGARVKQGQVIGTVGATGLASGPHLHYEVIKNKVHVNPLLHNEIKFFRLSEKEMENFNLFKTEIEKYISKSI